jgi:hypothetical protein
LVCSPLSTNQALLFPKNIDTLFCSFLAVLFSVFSDINIIRSSDLTCINVYIYIYVYTYTYSYNTSASACHYSYIYKYIYSHFYSCIYSYIYTTSTSTSTSTGLSPSLQHFRRPKSAIKYGYIPLVANITTLVLSMHVLLAAKYCKKEFYKYSGVCCLRAGE